MSRLLVLPVAVPLLAAGIGLLARRSIRAQRVLGFAVAGFLLAFAVALVAATADGTVLVTQVGGWPPGFAIAFVGDLFAALMLLVAALMILTCTAFAAARREDAHPMFHVLVLVLAAGIGGSFLTADVFNLFVFFEVMLIASYVLLTLGGTRARIRGGAVYVATNLMASTLLVAGVALAYGATGTVNMAALGEAVETTPNVAVAGGFLLTAFAVKAALVPVHGWLPRAYPVAPPAVAALFSGLLTKVGVYAMFRVYAVVFGGDPGYRPLLLWIASATMALGVLGAIGREGFREILSFHIVSQIGYMIMGLGLFGPLGLAGGIFYVLHHIVVKTSLFLSAGAVETIRGTGALARLGGLGARHGVLAAGFMVSALSLAGLPPLSGFFAKLALVRAAFEGAEWGVAAVAIAVSFLTLASMLKIWNGVFWGHQPALAGGAVAEPRLPRGRLAALVAPALFLAVVSVILGIWAEGLLELSERAAAGLLDPFRYVQAVLGR